MNAYSQKKNVWKLQVIGDIYRWISTIHPGSAKTGHTGSTERHALLLRHTKTPHDKACDGVKMSLEKKRIRILQRLRAGIRKLPQLPYMLLSDLRHICISHLMPKIPLLLIRQRKQSVRLNNQPTRRFKGMYAGHVLFKTFWGNGIIAVKPVNTRRKRKASKRFQLSHYLR